ncbi:acetate--CoA ligase family protein [Methylobacterium platani]|uniref:ATP-grasp domain-containing protein n=2 Tax=Methylobacterium platani TaxID=427683 RepID=A0A179SCQ7_9HYPH|nr:acetate--CoA ligase [Methylobacterium platani]KMO16294.1 hypothetical protein SQ03_14930 [Methylobacterium platani JCM 14648]OAS24736.1 hypothetical protein A5481_13490 [Methylobacterium platani]
MSASLTSLLAPGSIAIIGASPERTRIRGALLHLLRANGYAGRIYPINPSYPEIDGLRCYPDVAAVGGPVDLALVAIPAEAVLPALEQCAAAGIRNAVVISSGFAEDTAAAPDLQGRIAALARRTGMRICGPNAEGFYNEPARVTATFSPAVEDPAVGGPAVSSRRIGVVAQSGGIGFALYNRGRALGLSFSSIVSTGNEADLSAADFFRHMAEDPETDGVLLFIESIRDLPAFRAAARAAASAGKPVVAIKVGGTEAGSAAAASHTASMTGWQAGYEALFRQLGIGAASDLDEALSVMGALITNPPARGDRVAILTVSGGAGALAADSLSLAGLQVPALSAATQARIRDFIPSYGTARNPVDLTAQGAQGGGTLRAANLLLDDDDIDIVVIVTSLANPHRVTLDGTDLGALVAARRKPVLVHSYTLPSPLGLATMAGAGVAVLRSMGFLAAAARALARTGAAGSPPDEDRQDEGLPDEAVALLGTAGPLTEPAAKAVLAACGIETPPSRLVRDEAALDAAAEAVGYPLAAKVVSPGIAHKTEAGGVRLGIAGPDALREAYRGIRAAAARHAPDAAIEGVLLERMAPGGVEVIVSVLRDPAVGPVVTVGAGGTQAEIWRDTVHRIAPVDEGEAAAMLGELRSFPLLAGFRGAPPADAAALAHLVARLSRLAVASPRIAELELNPVIVHPEGRGCTIADALLVVASA